MNVYKVLIENKVATLALATKDLHHGDVGLKADQVNIQWLALECNGENEAIEVTNMVLKTIWYKEAK